MIISKTTGLDDVMAHIEALTSAPVIRAGMAAEGYHSAAEGKPQVANAKILNSQGVAGRKPHFVDAATDKEGMRIVREMCDAWIALDPELVQAKANELAKVITAMVKRHVDAGQSEGGPMTPLSERYKKIKELVYHAGDKPILVRTGELMASLVPSVVVRMGKK